MKKSIICFDMDSIYNFKVLLYYLVNTQKVLYITTYMPPEEIIHDIDHIGLCADNDLFISIYDRYFKVKPSEYHPEMDLEIIEFLEEELEMFRARKGMYSRCDDDWIIVLDTLSFFLNLEHVDKYHKLHLVDRLYKMTKDLNTLCYITILNDAQQGSNKETEILVRDLCNVVIDAKVVTETNGDIVSVLTIPKLHGCDFSAQIPPLKVRIVGGQVIVDTSQQIA